MAQQRPDHRVPALRGSAYPLPLRDNSVDAAMAVVTVHHWDDELEPGVRELRHVARGPVVVVTYDPAVSRADVVDPRLPARGSTTRLRDLSFDREARTLAGRCRHDRSRADFAGLPDWNFVSFWAHPERVLDGAARKATSSFSRMDPDVVARVTSEVERDPAQWCLGRTERSLASHDRVRRRNAPRPQPPRAGGSDLGCNSLWCVTGAVAPASISILIGRQSSPRERAQNDMLDVVDLRTRHRPEPCPAACPRSAPSVASGSARRRQTAAPGIVLIFMGSTD